MIVIDCSAMIELLTAKTEAGEAVGGRVAAAHALYAPHVIDEEIVSALLGLSRGKKITEGEADAALSNYRAFPIARHDVLPLWGFARQWRCIKSSDTGFRKLIQVYARKPAKGFSANH